MSGLANPMYDADLADGILFATKLLPSYDHTKEQDSDALMQTMIAGYISQHTNVRMSDVYSLCPGKKVELVIAAINDLLRSGKIEFKADGSFVGV